MQTSLILIAIFTGVIALANLLLLGGLAYLAVTVTRLINTSVKPAIGQVQATVQNVNKLVDRVETKTEEIMDIGENTARQVSDSVVTTTDVLRDVVASPFISVASLVTGIQRAMETWRRTSARTART